MAVAIGTTVLFAGCSQSKEQTTTTAMPTEYTTTTTSETELTTETEETEPTTVELAPLPTGIPVSLDAFANINEETTIDDVINEVGPYARMEFSNMYVWTIDDGSEVWVCDIQARESTNKLHEAVLAQEGLAVGHVEGLQETLMFSSIDSMAIGQIAQLGQYEVTLLLPREYGPDLEEGYYILEEDGYVYIVISAGRQETRGNGIYINQLNLTKIDYDHTGLKIETTPLSYELEEQDLGRQPCPCAIVRLDQMPENYVVVNHYRVDIPFKGYIKDSKTWEVIPAEEQTE